MRAGAAAAEAYHLLPQFARPTRHSVRAHDLSRASEAIAARARGAFREKASKALTQAGRGHQGDEGEHATSHHGCDEGENAMKEMNEAADGGEDSWPCAHAPRTLAACMSTTNAALCPWSRLSQPFNR